MFLCLGSNHILRKCMHSQNEADAKNFIFETQMLFDALGKRVDRENNELYSMADKIAA